MGMNVIPNDEPPEPQRAPFLLCRQEGMKMTKAVVWRSSALV
jgi:hypothetical protein